jgi:hypothetical protein
MFKKFLILMVLTVLAITSSMAMDPVRIAGQASSTNVKNVTLDLTIRVYDASNNEIYHVGIPDIYFDQESAFSFVWDALFVNYNPLYLLKIENSLNGIILFESRLDKVINAQTQYRAYVDPDEINGAPTAGLVLVSNGVTTEWSTISPSMLSPLIDLQTAYDNSANSAPYVSAGGVNFGNGKIIDVTGNKIKIVRERTAGGNIGSAFNASVSNPEDGYSAIAASVQDINYDDAAFIDAAGSEYSAIEGKLDEGTSKWFGLLGAAVNMDGGLPTPSILKAGVIGVTPLTTAAGALGVTFGGNDYAGYFVGDVNVTAAVTANTYNGFTLPAGDAPFTGDVLASTGMNKTLEWVTPSGGGGGGTVTSVSVVSANGVSGTVATATTTPAITLVLGDIVPSSVNGYILPPVDGTSGQVLTTDGSGVTSWTTVSGGGGGGGASWLLGGNLGTTPPDMFLGTLDAQDVVFKLNSTIAGTIGLDNNTSLGLNSMHNVVQASITQVWVQKLYILLPQEPRIQPLVINQCTRIVQEIIILA